MLQHTNTKHIKRAYEEWKRRGYCTIYDCYANPSTDKRNAWGRCCYLALCFSGYTYTTPRVIGYNSKTFSVGFLGEIEGKPAFFYITKTYDRYIYLDEI